MAFLVDSCRVSVVVARAGSKAERAERAGMHAFREAGAPEYVNYALWWIGMANTIFLLDLYGECINSG
jgi:hypothetical protein